MFAAERLRFIRQYLTANGQIEVTNLSGMLGVSEVTIRKDLERLERDGFLIRTHGGAILQTEEDMLTPVSGESSATTEEKEIAKTACSLLKSDSIILLSGGSITSLIAAELASSPIALTILTNSLEVCLTLQKTKQIPTLLLGGALDNNEKAVYGDLTIAAMRELHVNEVYYEADGLNGDLLTTAETTGKARFIQEAIRISDREILLLPSKRFGRTAFSRIGRLKEGSTLITDTGISDECKELTFRNGIRLYNSIGLYEFGTETGVLD